MKFADRLKFTAAGTNAATITFTAGVTGFRTLAQAISDGKLSVGDTGVPFTIDDGSGNKETSLFTVTSSTVLTRTSVSSSSAGGTTPATFTGAALSVFNSLPADFASKLPTMDTDVAGVGGLFVVSTATPVNADGRPNGTVYFQNALSSGALYSYVKINGVYQSVGNPSIAIANPASYSRMQSSLAAVSAGTGYSKVGLVGDSTMAGYGGSGSNTPARASTPVVFLRDKLIAAQSRPTIASSWFGDQHFSITNSISPYTFDSRFSQPDGTGYVATSTGAQTIAGSLFNNGTNVNRLGFLPEGSTDTTDVYYALNTTLGVFSVIRNGGTSSSINQVAATGTGKTTYSSPLNSVDPIYAARTSGDTYIIGMDSYNSAVKSIRLFGLGWAGGRAADFAGTSTGFASLNALVAMNLDLAVLRFGTNDISIPGATTTSTDPTAYQASINKMIDALLAAGTNVILATHYPFNTTVTAQSVQDTYAGYVRSIATSRGLKLHDTYARLGTWASANTAGKMYDNLHPNAAGYQDDAAALSTLILSLA